MKKYDKIKAREYREKNKEKLAAYQKQHVKNNRAAATKRMNRWRKKNPARVKDLQLFHSFGISLEYYAHMFNDQNGECAICSQTQEQMLCVDHDHLTKKIRGLLCRKCNSALGLFQDSEVILANALKYKKKGDL